MAYERVNWTDHVVEHPNTYKEQINADGTVTHHDASGEVIQQGTPMSATNFNKSEEALQHYSVAFDWLFCVMQAQTRELQTMKEQLAALASG